MIFFPVNRAQTATPQSVAAAEAQQRVAKAPPAIATPVTSYNSPPAPMEVPSLPSMTQMAKNVTASLMKTAKAAVKGQGVRLSKEEADHRLAICQVCQFFRQVDQRCSKCGCFMAVKTYLRAETCPVNRW